MSGMTIARQRNKQRYIAKCKFCRKHLGSNNRTGICHKCGSDHRCRCCGFVQVKPLKRGLCAGCNDNYIAFRQAWESVDVYCEPKHERQAERIARYMALAAKEQPLFSVTSEDNA